MTLGRYRVVRHLSAGGMGSIFEAIHIDLRKSVALKVLRPEQAQDPQARVRFEREATTLSKLEHPHVVTITDFGFANDIPFIVMELLRGEDLGQLIRGLGHGLAVGDAVDILLAACSAVAAAHSVGVIHRDIKPANIFLARNMKETVVKIVDFGIAYVREEFAVDVDLTGSGNFLGTPRYASPEHTKGGKADTLSDQYSLALVLYECVTGKEAFGQELKTPAMVFEAVAAGNIVRPSALRRDFPLALEKVLFRALSVDPRNRFPSVIEFGRALYPHASPLARGVWANVFGRPAGPAPLYGVAEAPFTAPLLTPFSPPAPTTHEGVPSGSESNAPSETQWAHATTVATRKRSSRLGLLLLGAVLGLGVLGLTGRDLVMRKLHERAGRDALPAGQTLSPEVPKSPKLGSPFGAPTPASPFEAATSIEVRVTGIPDGTTAKLDGEPAILPLHIPRDSQPHELILEAPGYLATKRTITASRDLELDVALQRPAIEVRTAVRPAPEPGAAERRSRPPNRTKRPVRPGSPEKSNATRDIPLMDL